MRKQYWTIIQPDGDFYIEKFCLSKFAAESYLESIGKRDGLRVVKIWVEIEGELKP